MTNKIINNYIIDNKLKKYMSISVISWKNNFVYLKDFIISTLFLIVILFIFLNLWRFTYSTNGSKLIEGYSLSDMIWYLMVTESMIMAFPELGGKIQRNVKNGQIATYLIKPFNYLIFQFINFFNEFILRFSINFIVGSCLIIFIFNIDIINITNLLYFFPFFLISTVLQFSIYMIIALSSFWLEEVQAIEFVYNRLIMTLGGMILPLDIFPQTIENIAKKLPFQTIVYLPAKFMVKGQHVSFNNFWLTLFWLFSILLILGVVYRLGVKKIDINGG